jgi:hypothetical protein
MKFLILTLLIAHLFCPEWKKFRLVFQDITLGTAPFEDIRSRSVVLKSKYAGAMALGYHFRRSETKNDFIRQFLEIPVDWKYIAFVTDKLVFETTSSPRTDYFGRRGLVSLRA